MIMKRANVKQHDVFDAAQTRLRLLLSVLENNEPEIEDDLESLDFTGTSPEPEAGEDSGAVTPSQKAEQHD
jgi:hypothetical protein